MARLLGDRRAFDLAHEHLAPQVEVKDIDVPDLSLKTVGSFDIVLFAGVLYHLPNPMMGLQTLRPLVKRTLIVETHLDAKDVPQPAAIFYTHGFYNDPSNWWGPNRACVEGMLQRAGFEVERYADHPTIEGRGIFHAKPA